MYFPGSLPNQHLFEETIITHKAKQIAEERAEGMSRVLTVHFHNTAFLLPMQRL